MFSIYLRAIGKKDLFRICGHTDIGESIGTSIRICTSILYYSRVSHHSILLSYYILCYNITMHSYRIARERENTHTQWIERDSHLNRMKTLGALKFVSCR